MLDPKKAEVNTVNSLGEVEKLKVADINTCDETQDFGDFTIEYPYELTIKDSKGNVVLKEKTQSTMRAKNWTKKFYIKETDSGGEFPAFSRYVSLLAVLTIKKEQEGELPAKINLNDDVVGFEFEGVVVRIDGMDPFIDWVGTFEANGVHVPSVSEILGEPEPETKGKTDIKAARESFNKKAKKGGSW
jgi:hypothetical protein